MKIRDDIQAYAKLIASGRSGGYIAGQVEVTNSCFQNCIACDNKNQEKHSVELATMKSICRQLAEMPCFGHLTLTGGDPQAWSHFKDFCTWWLTFGPSESFNLQLTTALMKPIEQRYADMFSDIRVSVDAVDPDLYRKLRGVKIDPDEILARADALRHPRLAVLMTVFDENIDQIVKLVYRLDQFRVRIRKLILIPAYGVKHSKKFWERYDELSGMILDVPTSFGESPDLDDVKRFDVPCYCGQVSFHIKPNGDVYPCCEVGGEATPIFDHYKIGNVNKDPLESIRNLYMRNTPKFYYEGSPCMKLCLFKQSQINMAVHRAKDITLSIP